MSLSKIAESNIKKLPKEMQRCSSFDLQNLDIKDYEIERENTVIFMYEPFSVDILRPFLEKVHQQIFLQKKKVIFIQIAFSFLDSMDQSN